MPQAALRARSAWQEPVCAPMRGLHGVAGAERGPDLRREGLDESAE